MQKNKKTKALQIKIIEASEIKNMVEASLDGWLTTGRFKFKFQKKLVTFLGVIDVRCHEFFNN